MNNTASGAVSSSIGTKIFFIFSKTMEFHVDGLTHSFLLVTQQLTNSHDTRSRLTHRPTPTFIFPIEHLDKQYDFI